MDRKLLFTSEAVSEGHPDKVCDQISDAILDECLKVDKGSRVACEVMIGENVLIINGEITCKKEVDYVLIAKKVLKNIGYNSAEDGFDTDNAKYHVLVKKQSFDIANAVNKEDMGAGDQGIMFGYAINETSSYMPLAIKVANDLLKRASKLRKKGKFKFARPDMKSQVTIEQGKDKKIKVVLLSIQHTPDYNEKEFKEYIKKEIVEPTLLENGLVNKDYELIINPSGRFVIGGPLGDVGLTGRKIIVDTYGGRAHHGGGAFSGKDPTKVDRTAAYYCRYVAKNIVASGIANECEIQVSYAIGLSRPLSIDVNAFNTSKYKDEEIVKMVKTLFDFRPKAMIESLDLLNMQYLPLASYGHFGREELNLSFEKLDKVSEIREYFKG
jgi:S-adenosylmethionine synthetase